MFMDTLYRLLIIDASSLNTSTGVIDSWNIYIVGSCIRQGVTVNIFITLN